MVVYLASPNGQQQADALRDMPVVISFADKEAVWHKYAHAWDRVLIDSGAYSLLTTGKGVDIERYADWVDEWKQRYYHIDAVAGLDDIAGDWRRSLANYASFPLGFPTFHDTDPPDLLDDLIPMARERGGWLGLGLKPPREGKGRWIRNTCNRIPDGIHVHGWAMRAYTSIRRLDSVDSTNWWRDAMKLRTIPDLSHLTYGECLEIVVKRYQRWTRVIRDVREEPSLFPWDGEMPCL